MSRRRFLKTSALIGAGAAAGGFVVPGVSAARQKPSTAARSKPIRIRVTVDARGRVVRVELIAGDRSAESCLRTVVGALSSITSAQGSATGTVEITLRAR